MGPVLARYPEGDTVGYYYVGALIIPARLVASFVQRRAPEFTRKIAGELCRSFRYGARTRCLLNVRQGREIDHAARHAALPLSPTGIRAELTTGSTNTNRVDFQPGSGVRSAIPGADAGAIL